jgi:hypothetical protein
LRAAGVPPSFSICLDGRAEAVPAGQGEAALAPAETPGNGAQVFDLLRGLARGRARADVEFGDLADRRGAEEVFGEAGGVVDQGAVGRHAGFRQLGRGLQKGLGGGLGRLQQRGFQRGGDQGFQVAPADFGVGVFGADHLALLRQADLPAHRAGRLRQDGLVARAAAAADRAAAAVEHAQLDVVRVGQHVEQVDQRDLGAVELPVAGEDAAVLVAVGVAQHDVLLGAAALDQLGDAGQRVELAHDGRGIAQVFDGFEQRHDDQVVGGVAVQRAVHQADFLLQQQHFQQVAHGFGVADDVVADRLFAEAGARRAGGFENREFACARGPNRPRPPRAAAARR